MRILHPASAFIVITSQVGNVLSFSSPYVSTQHMSFPLLPRLSEKVEEVVGVGPAPLSLQMSVRSEDQQELRFKPRNPNYGKYSKDKKDDRNNELKRTKFALYQVKGNLQESEMRATAAERRVAVLTRDLNELQKDIKEAPEVVNVETKHDFAEREAKHDDLVKQFEKQVHELTEKVKSLTESMSLFKTKSNEKAKEMEAKHEREREEWETKKASIEKDLEEAKSALFSAVEEVSELTKMQNDLTAEIKRIVDDSHKRQEAMKMEHSTELTKIKTAALEERTQLGLAIKGLEEEKLAAEKHSEKLRMDIDDIKRQARDELIALKTKSDRQIDDVTKDLVFHKIELGDRNDQIENFEAERKSIRVLLRLQARLVKLRVKKRYRKVFPKKNAKKVLPLSVSPPAEE